MDLLNSTLIIFIILAGFSVAYQLIPYRKAGNKKPAIALLPKYKKNINLNLSQEQLEIKLANLGFKKFATKNGFTYFTRGFLLGDFSLKIAKLKLGIKKPYNGLSAITLEGGWFLAFDTGDSWELITELANKLENAKRD